MSPEQAAEVLGKPLQIGHLTLANRLVMGPMAVTAAEKNGAPSEQTIAMFEARARGGVGMIIVGGAFSTTRAFDESPFKPCLRMDIDDFVPEFRRVADAVHAYKVPIIAEIMPGFGRMGSPAPGRPNITASEGRVVIPQEQFPDGFIVPGGSTTPVAQEATIAQIEEAERDLVACALRMQRAGWDGVEVAAHMSYFAASFLSPRSNRRTDRYGGSAENRARMLVNIVRETREKAGADFVIGLRITANDYMPDGQGPEGFAEIAKLVEAAGLDYVALSTGCYETMRESAPSVDGALVDSGDADVFKQALSVPVLIQGLHDPIRAARALAEGHGDAVMLARQMLADPDYPAKAVAGRFDTIVRCTRGNECMRRMVFQMPVRCTVNPQMGREARRGKGAPLDRIVKAPIERAVLALTGSPKVMGLAGKFIKKAS
ncbi:2,4-dienoyl-CoA reductase (NADPH2) [Novosphingobium chloroacetimidivorans]|uniref:2,4-dienoyl-CoA reductase (NADPH2) n=1 Tax=Novosphingobium chloroacetimidivorans TaxID=1428314 RepID=A0A7W7KAU2_9SPHN|nr:NADH:flavin oxidoreductase [Novosphingobium chloroacetimidivorans]MBB4858678.1 2,4-dienoyl-CoA reductase (NADPH2) [Novosphingobium chloroacetimidivorans]